MPHQFSDKTGSIGAERTMPELEQSRGSRYPGDTTQPGIPQLKYQVLGLEGASKAWQIARFARKHERVAVFVKDRRRAEELCSDLAVFFDPDKISQFPGWESIPFEPVSPPLDVSATRLALLDRMLGNFEGIVVLTPEVLLQRAVRRQDVTALSFTIQPGQQFGLEEIASKLEVCGYQKVSLVESPGEIAVHGRVIDIFPALQPYPVRIEFGSAGISSLRTFDLDSQRSLNQAESLRIVPAREWFPLDKGPFSNLLPQALERLKQRAKSAEVPPSEFSRAADAIQAGALYPGIELLYPLLHGNLPSVLDYLDRNTLIAIDNQSQFFEVLETYAQTIAERAKTLLAQHYLIPHTGDLYLSVDELTEAIGRFQRADLDSLELDLDPGQQNVERIRVRTINNSELQVRLQAKMGSGKALAPLARFVERLRRNESSIAFVVGSQQRAERLQASLLQSNIDARVLSFPISEWLDLPHRYPVIIGQGQLSLGFQLPEEHLAFVAEGEIFPDRSQRRGKGGKLSIKRLLGSLSLLAENDFVVHTDFGVGIYRGLKHLEVEGSESDFLQIDYADSVLYLPVHQIGKVQKFTTAEGQTPKVDKLGSRRWIQTKERIKKSVVTLAGDLLKLYAARSIAKGWRFDPAGAEDERFAEEFAFEETPDQLKAIKESLADMASDKPMDRLICGDVGFGKTEVAIRAAFKCLQHSRQVAVLVPTTILVEQHKQTFERRFSGYPYKIAALSRFYSTEQNKQTLEALNSGDIDIVIGTHRLLSRDVQFKDLGLLVIDEEHRFGVRHKERLKSIKKQIDVLTLSATPIPRTLHMSLLGIRDISLISTAPLDRRVIRSYIAAYDESLVRSAILRELQRGGQCFFVHNKVQTIDAVTAALSGLVPEARFAFAHGQMSERQLENIMQSFLKREIDVLVSTTIIESGLDIPAANTILIDRADTFGLAQLYQLRGRVGRSTVQAFAYFLIPKARSLSIEAQRRLKALQALDDLGLGFNLALRDLEIRGTGNLLGKEQSGNIHAIGFDLYTKILKEAIYNLKGQELSVRETVDPELSLGVNAYLPASYVPDVSERLVLYQRFCAIESSVEADDLLAEVQDRFGPLPPEAHNLCQLMRYRSMLRDFGVAKADLNQNRLLLTFSPNAPIDIEKLMSLSQREPKRFKFTKALTLSCALQQPLKQLEELYSYSHEILVSVFREQPG